MTPEQTFNAAYFERRHPHPLRWVAVAALLAVLVLGAFHPANAQHKTAPDAQPVTASLPR